MVSVAADRHAPIGILKAGKPGFAHLDRQSAQILACSSSRSKASTACAPELWHRISSNSASPLSSRTMASPSIRQERTGSAATAAR
jgi:hypothetical protein